MFRSAFYNLLRNAFGKKPQIQPSVEVAYLAAVRIVRQSSEPGFIPAGHFV